LLVVSVMGTISVRSRVTREIRFGKSEFYTCGSPGAPRAPFCQLDAAPSD
jgi:hypothetical protein